MDCDKTNAGCEGGNMDYAFEWVVANGGIDSETNYPYSGAVETCRTKKVSFLFFLLAFCKYVTFASRRVNVHSLTIIIE